MIGWPQIPVCLETLRQQVRRRLAELGHLEENAFPMTERVVVRAGQPCGIYFCLHGPRSVKLTAVADINQKTVLLYGSDGGRAGRLEIPG